MSLSRSLNRIVAKATYDPELEKQLAEERKKAREERATFRTTLEDLRKKDNELIIETKLTPTGATQSAAVFKVTNDWLSATPDATSEEILDKSQEVLDKLAIIYSEDANRLYFFNVIQANETVLTTLKTTNRISDDSYTKSKNLLDKEKTWLERNPNESIQVYKNRIDTLNKELVPILTDPDVQQRIQEAQGSVKLDDSNKTLQDKKKEADRLALTKLTKEKNEFNTTRLFKKAGAGMITALVIAIILSFAILGGSLAANEAVIRPLPYKLLFFSYGFLFFPVVILYFVGRYFIYGKPPYFASYLIPLYEYDPLQGNKESFLQRLVYYKMNPVIEHALRTFQEAADSVKDMKVDFQAVATSIKQAT